MRDDSDKGSEFGFHNLDDDDDFQDDRRNTYIPGRTDNAKAI